MEKKEPSNIFISWSGNSKKAALAIKEFMPMIDDKFRPFVSSISIDAGEQWLNSINANLAQVKFGIICLTPENRNASWLLFEAGALSQKMDGKGFVVPLVFRRDFCLEKPLSIFQAKKFNQPEFLEVMISAFNRIEPEEEFDEKVFEKRFNSMWSELQEKVADSFSDILEDEITSKEESLPNECRAEYIVTDVQTKNYSIVDVIPDTSDLFFILLTCQDGETTRTFTNRLAKSKKFLNDIKIEAVYETQGAWDVLIKFRSTGLSEKFYNELTTELENKKQIKPEGSKKYGARKLINFLGQSNNIQGLMAPSESETIQYTMLSNSDDYLSHRAKRSFIIAEIDPEQNHERIHILKVIKDQISDSRGAKIIESVIESSNEIVFELFSSCATSNAIDYLNKDLDKALDKRGVAIFAKACFGHPSPSKQQKLNATAYAFGAPAVLRTCHFATPS